jgi:hypothetical protein
VIGSALLAVIWRANSCWKPLSGHNLSGPNPLSGSPHAAAGSTPGLAVIQVTQEGKGGVKVWFGLATWTPQGWNEPIHTVFVCG